MPPHDALEDAELLERLKARDEAAVETLITRYEARVFGLVLRLTGHRQDAEEVLQDVFWQVVRHAGSFRGQSKLSTWIYRIATNAALMKIRGRAKGRDVPLEEEALGPAMTPGGMMAEGIVDWTRLPNEELERKELAQRLAAAMDELPPEYRAVLVLRDVERLPAAAACEVLGLALPALKSRLHRARLFLRKRLADYVTAGHPALAPSMPRSDDASLP